MKTCAFDAHIDLNKKLENVDLNRIKYWTSVLKDTADTIPEENVTTVTLDDQQGRIMLKWAEPPYPNGLIVKYQVHAQRVKKKVQEV